MKRFQDWESAVMLGEDFSTLRYHDIVPGSVSVFAIANGEHRYFECDKDFEVDYKAGKIRRLPESELELLTEMISDDLTQSEIARTNGVSRQAVNEKVRKIRTYFEKLRKST